jgi:4-methyl-5(b-hydroxyethyl)-thiazole monophosphate biosynthesis
MVYVFLADGFEEIETISPIDILRRGKVEVKTVGVTGKVVTGAHGIPMTADITIDKMKLDENLRMVVLPGGLRGTNHLQESAEVSAAIKFAAENGLFVTAICAAPKVLGAMGLLEGRRAICFPGFEPEMKGAIVTEDYVVRDGNFITARGAGVASDFGFELLTVLSSRENAEKIRTAMQYLPR